MPQLILMVGPPGSGKSTYSKDLPSDFIRISQDEMGKTRHLEIFKDALSRNENIVVDRMGFSAEQRFRYLAPAKTAGYTTKIVVLHQPYKVCLERCLSRQNHETIKNEEHARAALQTFFTKYERPTLEEADAIIFTYPNDKKRSVVVSDLDGTVCDVEHRRQHVQVPAGQKKNWAKFFKEMVNDTPNYPVVLNLLMLGEKYPIVYCSGRPDNYRKESKEWLERFKLPDGELYMRNRHDSRQDDIIKEIILDFELKTRYDILMWFDDRQQVVDKLRERGVTVFQVAPGDF